MNLIYVIDYFRLARWCLPARKRKPKWLAWVYLIIYPVQIIYTEFWRYRKAVLYDLAITPQVCYLEQMLNDRYDSGLRRIYITDAQTVEPLYIYTDAEENPVDLFTDSENQPIILYTDAEIEGDLSDDFVVMVPSDVVFDASEMRSMVMRKRLPGMRFTIQIF